MCARVCLMARGHGLSARRQGGSSPAVHTPQHPQRPGAGTTTSTRGHRHHSHSQACQWYQPLQSQHFKYMQAPSMPQSTPVYPPSNPNMHLSQGKCPRTVLLSFANVTTDQGIIAQRLKFSYGVAEGATYVYITLPLPV